ncbi:MAG: response regulator [Rhodoferax sp.]|nr:response regulator [Rhodoferax sp.]MCF8210496.1 response regulator [Rhodoferax sp.]
MAKTILIVDDSAAIREALLITLQDAGYEVLVGCDGQDALRQLTGQKINLIISDVIMPNMDGIDFLKSVKRMPSYKFTPVIMLTTESAEALKMEGQNAGARAWVCKPFTPPKLLNAVQRFCLP